ncbi:gamma-aminobutyric acid type B receptor subunit 2-like [Haliotis cracherodii]|uniref:gamma-aminobutyric acid type B receptor subunit 2-like n=1 Tax=Haliotis cracherodii TaxID=6455 RepID=UPI0039EA8EB4
MAIGWKHGAFLHFLLLLYMRNIREVFGSGTSSHKPYQVPYVLSPTKLSSLYTDAIDKIYLNKPSGKHEAHPRHHRMFSDKFHSGKIKDWNIQKELAADDVLYIGGLFELSGATHAESGLSELRAAQLAVKHINEYGVVPGFNLELLYKDTKCDPGIGTDAFYDLIYRKPKMTMVMGSACTEVTKILAEIVPYWNLILISHAATSPALSEREKYNTFFRLAPGDSSLNPARRMLIQYFRWNTVATLYEDKEKFSLAMDDMGDVFDNHNISTVAALSFTSKNEVPQKMKKLKTLDVRILIGGFSQASARQVFCEAYKLGMYGHRYVWLLVGSFLDTWWNSTDVIGCTRQQLREAAEGYIIVSSLNNLMGDTMSVANLTTGEFQREYWENNGSVPMSMYASTTYDTMWTIALTLRATLERADTGNNSLPDLRRLNYSDMRPVKDAFMKTIEDLGFVGVSGPVSFKGSDRESIAVIYQNQDGNFTRVAVLEPNSDELDFNCNQCRDINWQGGRVPRDKKIVWLNQKTIDPLFFYVSCVLCGFGVIAAILFLTFNLHHRKLRYIKLSSPKLNNVAVVGCILVYSAVILLGMDDATLDWHIFPFVCTTRAFLLAAGFSLAFGAMFAKTYRVHQIFTRANSGLVKSKLLQDKHLLFIIGALLIVDSAVVFVWVLVDPMERRITNLTQEASQDDEDLLYLHQLTTCHSHHLEKWMGGFYAYKGLLLIFGVYMAWETRNVKIPALNDSQYIGMNVYNVVIMSISVVVLSNILSNQPTLAYAMESSLMFLSTTVTLCLLFVPKIYVIVSSKGNPVIASSGILVEANTRRFVFDDRKEIYYRAEVQNRVYKREMIELEQELMRLERLLEMPVEPYPRLTEELLYMLPETAVDGTPDTRRRRGDLLSGCSISDGGSVSCDIEENPDVTAAVKREDSFQPMEKRNSFDKTESALKKICRISRSLSIGPANYLKPRLNLPKPLSPCSKRSNILQGDSVSNTLPEGGCLQSYPKRRSDSAIELRTDKPTAALSFRDMQCIQSFKNNLQLKTSENTLVPKSPRTVRRLKNNTRAKPSIIEENEDCLEECPLSTGATLFIPSISYNQSNSTNLNCSYSNNPLIDIDSDDVSVQNQNGAQSRDVDSAFVKNRSLSKLKSTKTIIEHERRVRIRRLQTDLVKIQKELQDLDELEYEVSQV